MLQEEAEDLEESVLIATAFLQLMHRILDRCRAAGEGPLKAVREGLSAAYTDCRAGLGVSLRDIPQSYDELLITVRLRTSLPPPILLLQ